MCVCVCVCVFVYVCVCVKTTYFCEFKVFFYTGICVQFFFFCKIFKKLNTDFQNNSPKQSLFNLCQIEQSKYLFFFVCVVNSNILDHFTINTKESSPQLEYSRFSLNKA